MKKLLLFLCAIALILSLTACGEDEGTGTNPSSSPEMSATSGADEGTDEDAVITTVLSVTGMTCTRCENVVQRDVSALDGVISVNAVWDENRVVIKHETGVDVDQIITIIVLEGYTVEREGE